MPPLVVDVMTAHRAALLRRERTQMRAMAQQWLTVERALQSEVVRFTERVRQDGLTPGQIRSRQFQLDRFASLLRQVQTELVRYTDYAAPLISGQQREYAATGASHAADAISAVGTQYGVAVGFDRLPVAAVENMAGLAGDGSPLRSLLQGSFGVGADGMFNQLIAGVALGRNPRVVARMMVRDGLSQSLTRMLLIARTEQLRVYREASRQAYIHSGVVEQYKRLSAKNRRTCAACLMADGQVYDLDVPFEEHPAGRCTTVPVVAGLPPVQWQEGRDWFVAQSPDVQRSILGPGRYNAWKDGVFDLDQLVSRRENPTWGAALVPTPLRDLLNGAAQPVTIRRTIPQPVEVAPALPGPTGKPVGESLQLPKRGDIVRTMKEAIGIIDSVHGDGDLPNLPVKAGVLQNGMGAYYKRVPTTNRPVEIKINTDYELPTSALIHEVGHFIDQAAIQKIAAKDQRVADSLDRFNQTARKTRAIQGIDAMLILEGTDRRYLNYLRQDIEIWARAYMQYVAVRGDNALLRNELTVMQSWPYHIQWQDDDFEPVAAVMDELFKALGWRQ